MRIVIRLVDGTKIYFDNASTEFFNKMTADIENGKSIKIIHGYRQRNVFAHAIVSIEID